MKKGQTIVHVNQLRIRANIRKPADQQDPVLTVKTSDSNIYTNEVEFTGPSRIVYSPDKPLSCGARCWVVTDHPVRIIG